MKKGFTLIELLAVIVILAIIALIATPIVLNIINETKESANLRSAEMYLNGVEQSIARGMLQNKYIEDGTYNILDDGNICLEKYELVDDKYVCKDNDGVPNNNELIVEVDGEKPKSGNIAIINGTLDGASLELGSKTLGKSGNGGVAPVCILSSDSDKKGTQLGAKYECEVRPGAKQIFYVLSSEKDGSVNLIMDRNMCSDGKEAPRNNTCYVSWNSSGEGQNAPTTAMDYLEKATSSWINLTKMTVDYYDDDTNTNHSMES